MSHAIDNRAFDRAAEQVFQLLTVDQLHRLASIHHDPVLEDRVADLAMRVQEDELSPAELAEYEGYVRANNLLAVLRGMARRRLDVGQV